MPILRSWRVSCIFAAPLMPEADHLPCLVPRLGVEGAIPPRPQMPSWSVQAQMHLYFTVPQVHITWYLHLSLHDAQYRSWYWLPACRAFYGTETIIVVSTTTRCFSLPWATQILPSYFVKILTSTPSYAKNFLSFIFPAQILNAFISPPTRITKSITTPAIL